MHGSISEEPGIFSAWATFTTVLALAALWRLVHACFSLGILAHSPQLGRLRFPDGRCPTVLADHFASLANAVVCLAAAAPAARRRLAASDWSLGALFPLWSRPLAVGPSLPGTSTFYLSLAAFCLHSSILAGERVFRGGGAAERAALLQRALLLLVAASMCTSECAVELSLVTLLLEIPSPFISLWEALKDFRAHSDPFFGVVGYAAVFAILKTRLAVFGFCLVCCIAHPNARQQLWASAPKRHVLILCIALFVAYAFHFASLLRDVRRSVPRSDKGPGTVPRPRHSREIRV